MSSLDVSAVTNSMSSLFGTLENELRKTEGTKANAAPVGGKEKPAKRAVEADVRARSGGKAHKARATKGEKVSVPTEARTRTAHRAHKPKIGLPRA